MFVVGQRCASNFWYHGIVCRSSESRSKPASYTIDGKPILFRQTGSTIEIHAQLLQPTALRYRSVFAAYRSVGSNKMVRLVARYSDKA